MGPSQLRGNIGDRRVRRFDLRQDQVFLGMVMAIRVAGHVVHDCADGPDIRTTRLPQCGDLLLEDDQETSNVPMLVQQCQQRRG